MLKMRGYCPAWGSVRVVEDEGDGLQAWSSEHGGEEGAEEQEDVPGAAIICQVPLPRMDAHLPCQVHSHSELSFFGVPKR